MGASCSACAEDARWYVEDRRLAKCTTKNCVNFMPDVKRAKVVKVYDGDSITVAARHGRRGPPTLFKVRLAGIDSPEMRGGSAAEKEAAVLARDYLAGLILEKNVTLSNLQKEKYGRVLANVSYRGSDMSAALVAHGHAVAYDGGTKKAFNEPDVV